MFISFPQSIAVRTFIILWLGQMVSSIGSSMTYFALTLWVWQQTESVTAIALITFFFQLPQIGIALFSGIIVDYFPRKLLLVLSDVVAAGCTLFVGLLSYAQHLQIWHLYSIAAIYGCFGHIQTLTYSITVPLIVPQQHYTRANSMVAMVEYGAAILSPALAGVLYPIVGLLGINLIDLMTFAIAIFALLVVQIPQPQREKGTEAAEQVRGGKRIWREMTFGFRYIGSNSSLLAMVIALSLFAFTNQLGETLYEPMILARTDGSAQTLGTVVAASGVGGVIGALILSIWGGFRRQVRGMLIGFMGIGLSKIVFGVSQVPSIWVVAQFCSSLHTPLVFSSYMAVWYAKVAPKLQGRVFAADHLIGLVIGSISSLVAGSLADQIFEPAVRSGGWFTSIVSPLVGTGAGSGIALLYVINSICILLIGIGGYTVRRLREAETRMPDHGRS